MRGAALPAALSPRYSIRDRNPASITILFLVQIRNSWSPGKGYFPCIHILHQPFHGKADQDILIRKVPREL